MGYHVLLRATSHMRPGAHDHYTSSTLINGNRRSRSKFATSHYAWGTNKVCEGKMMDVKVYMGSYMASNGSCLIITCTIFKNHLLGLGLTQKQETMALWMLTTIHLFYVIMLWGPIRIEIHWNNTWLGAGCIRLHTPPLDSRIRDHTTWFWTLFTRALTISYMVTALGSCVMWP